MAMLEATASTAAIPIVVAFFISVLLIGSLVSALRPESRVGLA
jgi:hypothetical protein